MYISCGATHHAFNAAEYIGSGQLAQARGVHIEPVLTPCADVSSMQTTSPAEGVQPLYQGTAVKAHRSMTIGTDLQLGIDGSVKLCFRDQSRERCRTIGAALTDLPDLLIDQQEMLHNLCRLLGLTLAVDNDTLL